MQQLIIDINFEVDEVLNELSSSKLQYFDNVKEKLNSLRSNQKDLSPEEYLNKLFELRDGLLNQ